MVGRRRVESRVLPERRLELTVPQRRVPSGTRADARAPAARSQADHDITRAHDPQADVATDDRGYDPGMPHVPSVRRRRRRVPGIYLVPRQRCLPGLSGLHVF